MIGHPEMQELMHDDKLLETLIPSDEVICGSPGHRTATILSTAQPGGGPSSAPIFAQSTSSASMKSAATTELTVPP